MKRKDRLGIRLVAYLVGFVPGSVTKAFGIWRDHLYYGRISQTGVENKNGIWHNVLEQERKET